MFYIYYVFDSVLYEHAHDQFLELHYKIWMRSDVWDGGYVLLRGRIRLVNI